MNLNELNDSAKQWCYDNPAQSFWLFVVFLLTSGFVLGVFATIQLT